MENQLPSQPSLEPPKAPVEPVPTPLSGMEGGQGDGTAATNKSKIETAPSAETEIDKYMAVAREALSLSESDPGREAKMLEFMGKIEEAKARGEMEASVIGEGRDRAVILQRPEEVVVTEQASLSDPREKLQRFGDMTTRSDRYLAANRKGFTGFDVITDQSVQIDQDAEIFSGQGDFSGRDPWDKNPVPNPEAGRELFDRQYGEWLLKDCPAFVRRAASNIQGKVSQLMSMTDYQEHPNIRDYPEKWIDGKPGGRPGYYEAGDAWMQSDSIRPDGMWAGFIQVDDKFMDTTVTRAPGYNRPWFDIRQNPTYFRVEKPETVEGVLKANIREPKPQQQTVNQPPQPAS